MVLVPAYIEVDGLVAPLRVEQPIGDWPARALLRGGYPLLEGLQYAIGALIHEPAQEVLTLLHQRKDVHSSQSLEVSPVRPEDGDDFGRAAANWEQLTGTPVDMSDVYFAGASFVNENIVIPTSTFIKLMTRLYEINDALREGRMEPRIDESIPMPPPRPPPPPPKWTDAELHALEHDARYLDQVDPLTDEMSDATTARRAEDRRSYLFAMLEVAHRRVLEGETALPARFAQLELTELLRYQAAFEKLSAYLEAPERLAIVERTIAEARREANVEGPVTCAERDAVEGHEVTPYSADVSIDLFRLPEAAHPEGISKLEWLARCEAVFVYSRVTGKAATTSAAGDMFTRILGHRVRMRYRPEMTPVLRLWRVELV